MKTITLKTQDDFFDQINEMAQQQHLSKSALIRKAIKAYQKQIKDKETIKKIQASSLETRGMDKALLKDFEALDDESLLDSWED
ncbi:ribbon-helix-helix protein, CopG family [Candidatus Woesearchaeota archaeon]|jgi:predicted transcriptional regulator|nr:ribbon-helix-helix protein, CopG family [Candidatus Woesearchaeota archaeon]